MLQSKQGGHVSVAHGCEHSSVSGEELKEQMQFGHAHMDTRPPRLTCFQITNVLCLATLKLTGHSPIKIMGQVSVKLSNKKKRNTNWNF